MRIVNRNGKLSLQNEGQLEVFWLGVGSALATKHFQTNFLLIKGDTHVQVDYGMTGHLALLAMAGLRTTDLECHLPTHSHADHVGGYEGIGIASRYIGIPHMKKKKLDVIITKQYQEVLWDRTLRGGLEWNEEDQATQKLLTFEDYFNPIKPTWIEGRTRETFEVDYKGIHIEMFRTKHIPDNVAGWAQSFISYGLFVDKRVFISVDTRFDQDLIDIYAPQSEMMFHDVQFFPEGVHAPLEKLKGLPADTKAKMHLMHYSDNWESHDISDFAGWTKQGHSYIFD